MMETMRKKRIVKKALWRHVYETMREQIEQNRYGDSLIIPPEMKLMEEFSCSRVTIRRAMDELRKDGYIARQRGSGTSINPSHCEISTTLRAKQVNEFNDRRDRRIVSVTYETAPSEVTSFFQIPADQTVLKLERLLFSKRKPIAVNTTYLNLNLEPESLKTYIGSLYELLNEKGHPVTEILERFTASFVNDREQELLGLEEPVAVMRRVRNGSSGTVPIEYSYTAYLAGDYELTVKYSC